MREFEMRHAVMRYSLVLLFVFLFSPSLDAKGSYKSVLKKSTRHDRVFVWNNFEERLNWHATYFSEEFREARLEKLGRLYEWTEEERAGQTREDQDEARQYDVFFLGVYSGSSAWSEVGQDTGKWTMVLEVDGEPLVRLVRLEQVPTTQVERTLFPYLEKWYRAFLVRFPKTIQKGKSFRLRMTGIPASSELIWK